MGWDALRFCQDYSIQFWTEGKNVQTGWVNIQCPVSNCRDHSNHGGFNLNGAYYSCWKCGGHEIEFIISRLLHISKKNSIKIFTQYEDTVFSIVKRKKESGRTKIELPGEKLNKWHKKYLEKRKFDPDELELKYDLLGTGPGETWEGSDYQLRIILPVFGYNPRPISFQSRDITDKQKLRYKGCSPQFSIQDYKSTLYGLRHCRKDRALLVEGPIDQWRMGDGSVASFGTELTKSQIMVLSKFEKVFLLFDGENTAQEKARKVCAELSVLGVEAVNLELQLDKDPGELSEKEAKYIRSEVGLC